MVTGLNELLGNNGHEAEQKDDLQSLSIFLQHGLQDCLHVLIGIQAAGIFHYRRVPAGFSGRFRKALLKPVLGGLHELLIWLATQEIGPSLNDLSAYIQKNETGANGWLKRMVQFRNRWTHPEGETREEVLAGALPVFLAPPDLSGLGMFATTVEGIIEWQVSGHAHPLAPFVGISNGTVQAFSGFRDPGELVFPESASIDAGGFPAMWMEARLLDQALDEPTVDEIAMKAERLFHKSDYNGAFPDWLSRIFSSGPLAILIEPGITKGLMAGLADSRENVVLLNLPLNEAGQPGEIFASTLGLARTPTAGEFITFGKAVRPLVILLHADGLEAKAFLKVLLWLADLCEAGKPDGLRILIARSSEKLQQDQEKLWDRLPDNLDELLRKPPHAKGDGLPGYLWSLTLKKGMFRLFK